MSKLANKITRFTLYTYIKGGVASIHKETRYKTIIHYLLNMDQEFLPHYKSVIYAEMVLEAIKPQGLTNL